MAKSLKAIENARQRMAAGAGRKVANTEWYINEVCDKVAMTLSKRMKVVTELVRSKTVVNISIAVVKSPTGRVIQRSKSGEFPRADTAELMRTLFTHHDSTKSRVIGYVGTPMDYAIKLELELNRKFLSRTLFEQFSNIERILLGPI